MVRGLILVAAVLFTALGSHTASAQNHGQWGRASLHGP